MTIGYYTDNSISQCVMKAFSRSGVKVSHICDFDPFNIDHPIFYGILRGTGAAMRHLQYLGESFHYLDNGYFDAVYLDENKQKDMSGTYRLVKNGMIEPITILPTKAITGPMRFMVIPPSPYTAFMHDMTPEDWIKEWSGRIYRAGHTLGFGDKKPGWSFDDAVKDFDVVFAFNSIAVIRAVELGKSVYTTHGVIQNANILGDTSPYYDINFIKNFYKDKQFTLEQIADGAACLN